MSRLSETERAEILRSKAQATFVDPTEVDRFLLEARRRRAIYINRGLAKLWRASGLAALVCAVRRGIARRRTLAALADLDDRLLRDIGVERGDIGRIATERSQAAHPHPAGWLQRLKAELKRAAIRRQTIGQLAALDDRLLRDIGVERAAIPEVVDARLEGRSPTWRLETPLTDPRPGLTVKLSAALLLPFYLMVQGPANANEPTVTRKAA
ncbi:MAG: DUF1127 domain-containing protein [Kiloniellales bacterium]|nr:DUF1127 domain-containing protein [Kiloniellales bacterium]